MNKSTRVGPRMSAVQAAREALQVAEAHAASAQASYDAYVDGPECEAGDDGEHVVDYSVAADEAVEAARAAFVRALRGSTEPRQWKLYEEGFHYDTIEAPSAEAALEAARNNVDASNYNSPESTIWIDVRVVCEETGEEDSCTVRCDPPAPKCTADAHDWQSPHAILGGLKENPGVWGKGGGVIICEVCMHCGCERTTDTWAQRPDTGEQGLESVSYEAGKYADEVEALRADVDSDAA